jgi:hypothetical protein
MDGMSGSYTIKEKSAELQSIKCMKFSSSPNEIPENLHHFSTLIIYCATLANFFQYASAEIMVILHHSAYETTEIQ